MQGVAVSAGTQQQSHSRHLLCYICKILAAARRAAERRGICHSPLAQKLRAISAHAFAKPAVVYKRRATAAEAYARARAEGLCYAHGGFCKPFLKRGAALRAKCAHSAREHGFPRYRVCGAPCAHFAYGKHGSCPHAHFPCAKPLQSHSRVAGGEQSIPAVLRRGTVATLAVYVYFKIICRRRGNTVRRHHDFARADVFSRKNVEHQRRLHPFQNACLHHILRALQRFLRRLEHKHNLAAKLVFVHFQKLRRAKQHRRVHIVPTGVHIPVFRGKRQLCFLFYGQSVHVCTQKHTRALFFAANSGYHTGFPASFRLITQRYQHFPYLLCRMRQVKAHLRVRVDIAAYFGKIACRRPRFREQIFIRHKITSRLFLPKKRESTRFSAPLKQKNTLSGVFSIY